MFSCEKSHIFFHLCLLFKECISVGILVLPSQISYKCAFNFVIGAFKVRMGYNLICVVEMQIYPHAKDH